MDFFETKIQTREIIIKELLNCTLKIDENIEYYNLLKDYRNLERSIYNKKKMIETVEKLKLKISTKMF